MVNRYWPAIKLRVLALLSGFFSVFSAGAYLVHWGYPQIPPYEPPTIPDNALSGEEGWKVRLEAIFAEHEAKRLAEHNLFMKDMTTHFYWGLVGMVVWAMVMVIIGLKIGYYFAE